MSRDPVVPLPQRVLRLIFTVGVPALEGAPGPASGPAYRAAPVTRPERFVTEQLLAMPAARGVRATVVGPAEASRSVASVVAFVRNALRTTDVVGVVAPTTGRAVAVMLAREMPDPGRGHPENTMAIACSGLVTLTVVGRGRGPRRPRPRSGPRLPRRGVLLRGPGDVVPLWGDLAECLERLAAARLALQPLAVVRGSLAPAAEDVLSRLGLPDTVQTFRVDATGEAPGEREVTEIVFGPPDVPGRAAAVAWRCSWCAAPMRSLTQCERCLAYFHRDGDHAAVTSTGAPA